MGPYHKPPVVFPGGWHADAIDGATPLDAVGVADRFGTNRTDEQQQKAESDREQTFHCSYSSKIPSRRRGGRRRDTTIHVSRCSFENSRARPPVRAIRGAGWGGSGRIADGIAASLARGVTCAVPTRRATLYADPCFAAGHRCIADPASGYTLACS